MWIVKRLQISESYHNHVIWKSYLHLKYSLLILSADRVAKKLQVPCTREEGLPHVRSVRKVQCGTLYLTLTPYWSIGNKKKKSFEWHYLHILQFEKKEKAIIHIINSRSENLKLYPEEGWTIGWTHSEALLYLFDLSPSLYNRAVVRAVMNFKVLPNGPILVLRRISCYT